MGIKLFRTVVARAAVWGRPRTVLRRIAAVAAVAMALVFMAPPTLPTIGVAGAGLARAEELAVVQPGWTVSELRGAAKSRPIGMTSAADWIDLNSGMSLPPGTEITTSEDGFVVLVNGADQVQIMANSHVQLPIVERPGVLTRILHQLGTVFFEVGKRPGRQFEVDTPYLVAIVKGTKFSTQVSDGGGWVTVTEGVVGVAARSNSVSVDVTTGETATVSAGTDSDVQVGPTPAVDAPAETAPSPSTAPSVPSSSSTPSSGPAANNAGKGSGHGGGNGNGKGNGSGNGQSDEEHGCNGGGNCNGHGKHGLKGKAKSQGMSWLEATPQYLTPLNSAYPGETAAQLAEPHPRKCV